MITETQRSKLNDDGPGGPRDLLFLKRSLFAAYEKMADETLAGIRPDDCVLIIDEETARQLTLSDEIQIYLKSDQMFWEFPDGSRDRLPVSLYGFKIEMVRNYSVFPEKTNRHVIRRPFIQLVGTMKDYPVRYTCEIELQ